MTLADPIVPVSARDAASAGPGEEWAAAGDYAKAEEGFAHGLVVLAMGLPYVLRESAGETGRGFSLFVPAEARDAVRAQLELYDRESAGWPPAPRREVVPRKWREALFLALLWAWAAIAGFAAQMRWPETTEALVMDARRVFEGGEWWRAFTALFLHADTGHLVSNLGAGVFVFAAVFSAWGRRAGVALLTLSAVAANLATGAAHHPSEYRSLGASTAVFAALGLLTGRAARVAVAARAKAATGKGGTSKAGGAVWRAAWVPLGAGLTMLMLYGAGAGEARVDVPAHAMGFAVGLGAGFVFGRR